MTKPDAVKAFGMLMKKEEAIGLYRIKTVPYGKDRLWHISIGYHNITSRGKSFYTLEEVTAFLEGK